MLNIIFKNRNNKVIFDSFVFYINGNMLHARDNLIIRTRLKLRRRLEIIEHNLDF